MGTRFASRLPVRKRRRRVESNSDEALARGESEVRRIGRMLRQEGKQRRALWLFS